MTYYVQGYLQATGGEPYLLGSTLIHDHEDTRPYHESPEVIALAKQRWFGTWYRRGVRRVEITTTRPSGWPADSEELHRRNLRARLQRDGQGHSEAELDVLRATVRKAVLQAHTMGARKALLETLLDEVWG